MTIRKAIQNDLTDIVAIYNETIPGRMVTADTEEVSVADKQAWFDSHTEKDLSLFLSNKVKCLLG